MEHKQSRRDFMIVTAFSAAYAAVLLLAGILNRALAATVEANFSFAWRNDGAYAALAQVYSKTLVFDVLSCVLLAALLVFAIKEFNQNKHESGLCMIISTCLLLVVNFIPGVYLGMTKQVITLNAYNLAMLTGAFDLSKFYPLYAIYLFAIGSFLFYLATHKKQTPKPE